MSKYSEFIEKTLESEYTHLQCFKNDDSIKIDLYKHTKIRKKLVLIRSKNRNDHIFRILRGINHPNLPTVFDVCACDDYLMVLESYVEGESLSKLLQKGCVTKKQAVKYTIDVCEALKTLHEKQIIHRDIKPENIIISPDGKAILIDLQAARLVTDTDHKDTINLGTVGYAAPEQYGVHQSTPPTDIYAVGVLLNELIINCHPTVRIPSGKLGKIISKCTETQIYNRYQTVDKLIADLKRYSFFH
ncbi:MAG: serine/threonine protein kinase [Clostridia bacterium]|nr:serine/threonine protein kinase [Clostridia bacterium]